MQRATILLFFFACFASMAAQQSNTSLTDNWVQLDTDLDYSDYQRKVSLTKIAPSAAIANARDYESPTIGFQVIQAVLAGRLTAYSAPNLSKAIDPQQLMAVLTRPDTVTIFNPATYEERIAIVTHNLEPSDFTNIALDIQLTSDGQGDLQQSLEVLALQLPNTEKRPLLTDDPKQLFIRVKTSNKVPKTNKFSLLELYNVNLPRTDFDRYDSRINVDQLMTGVKQMAAINPQLFRKGNRDYPPMQASDFDLIFNPKDTLSSFDPNTYEEVKRVVELDFSTESIESVRLQFHLGWQEQKARLSFYPIGYAPIQSVRDQRGDLLYRLPLFHWLEKVFQ
ncbi:MAG: hypothetical protein AAF828_06960 [Bacteroidota bacterium]